MTNPVMTLIEWLKEEEVDIQGDVAFLMSGFHPSFDFTSLPSESEELLAKFYSKIESFSGTGIENAGFLITFRAAFDYLFVKGRGTKEGWDKAKERLEFILNSNAEDKPATVNATAKKALEELPGKMEKWFKICKQWQELKNTSLSDEAIEAWENENMLTRSC